MRKTLPILSVIVSLAIASATALAFHPPLSHQESNKQDACECDEPANVWFKVSTFGEYAGTVIPLDMSRGQSFSDPEYIYLVVKELESDEIIYIVFPNGGDWVADSPKDPFLEELDKEFKSLEDYLRSKQDKSTVIRKHQNK